MAFRLTAALLITGALSAAAPAFADSITLCTGCSNTTVTYDNTGANAPQNTGVATTGTAVVVPTMYASIAGTSYVSYDPNTFTNGSPVGTTVYTSTFSGNFSGGFGSIMLSADDTVNAYLNGILIGTSSPYQYNTIVGPFAYSGTLLKNGLNTLTFNVSNSGAGPTNLDYKFAAVTPEPNSLLLLGTGLVGVVGSMRKRLFA